MQPFASCEVLAILSSSALQISWALSHAAPECKQCCADHGETGAKEAWHRFTVLSLVAFTRHYFKAVASIVEQVEQDIFGEVAPLKESTLKDLSECLHV